MLTPSGVRIGHTGGTQYGKEQNLWPPMLNVNNSSLSMLVKCMPIALALRMLGNTPPPALCPASATLARDKCFLEFLVFFLLQPESHYKFCLELWYSSVEEYLSGMNKILNLSCNTVAGRKENWPSGPRQWLWLEHSQSQLLWYWGGQLSWVGRGT